MDAGLGLRFRRGGDGVRDFTRSRDLERESDEERSDGTIGLLRTGGRSGIESSLLLERDGALVSFL